MQRRTCYAVGVLLLLLNSRAQAWNRAGHMVCGALVYSLLKQDSPQTLTRWTAVLKQHPHFELHWRSRLEEAGDLDHDQCLWMQAARWPDDVRGDPVYDKPDWHYINFPYKPAGQPDTVTTVGPADVNIVTAYRANLEVLRGNAAASEQAVALCWVLHLVGDVHQPLHTTKLFTTEYPAPVGDRGGTLAYIRATSESDAITLHRFWDDLILGTESYREARNTATALRAEYAPRELTELLPQPADADFRHWAEVESLTAARRYVYVEGRVVGSPTREMAPVLPDGYAKSSKWVAERRLVLSAHRLARVIAHDHTNGH